MSMRTEDLTDILDLALQASGCDQAPVLHKLRLLSDNGSSHVSGWLGLDRKQTSDGVTLFSDSLMPSIPDVYR